MANTIKKGESLFIPFENGESIYDSQLKPRMYKTKEQYDRFSYRFKDAEMVEYTEVVRCKDCKYGVVDDEDFENQYLCQHQGSDWNSGEHFCSYGERKDNGQA